MYVKNGWQNYRIGPLNAFMEVETPPEGFDNSLTKFMSEFEGIPGTYTQDVFGAKRTWTIPLMLMRKRTLSFFEAMHTGALEGPIYLIDPRQTNRLGRSISASLTFDEYPRKYRIATGVASPVALPNYRLLPGRDFTQFNASYYDKLAPGPSRAMRWYLGSADDFMQLHNGPLPVVKNENLVLSWYPISGEALTVAVTWVDYRNQGLSSQRFTALDDKVDPANRKYVVIPPPTDPKAQGYYVSLFPPSNSTATSSITLYALQLEGRPLEWANNDQPSAWVTGDGVPIVAIQDMPTHASHSYQYVSGSIKIRET